MIRAIAAAGVLVTLASCRPSAPPPERPGGEVSLDSARAAIATLVAQPRCRDVAQCRSMAFGAKPCGGPRTYLIYSLETTDSAALAAAVAAYNRRDQARNDQLGLMSDCRMEAAPTLVCADGSCQARP